MEMGSYTSQGFAIGIAQNDNAVSRAAATMVRRAVGGAAGAAFASPSAGGGMAGAGAQVGAGGLATAAPGTLITFGAGAIQIHVSGAKSEAEAEVMGRAAARGFRDELRSMLPGVLREVA